MAQANFEPTFSCIKTLTILKPSYYSSYLPAYEDGTECSETSAYKIQTPGNYPEENIQQFGINSTCALYTFSQKQPIILKKNVMSNIISRYLMFLAILHEGYKL
jgi:hypothetical protein